MEASVTTLTALSKIREKAFGEASQKILKHQERYVNSYNKRHNIWRESPFSIGDRVQYKNTKKIGRKMQPPYYPAKSFLLIAKINKKTNTCNLKTRKGKLLTHRSGGAVRSWHFDFIRSFKPTVVDEIVSEDEDEVAPFVPIKIRQRSKKRQRVHSGEALCSDINSFDPSWF